MIVRRRDALLEQAGNPLVGLLRVILLAALTFGAVVLAVAVLALITAG